MLLLMMMMTFNRGGGLGILLLHQQRLRLLRWSHLKLLFCVAAQVRSDGLL
jgi:hypothetical protein